MKKLLLLWSITSLTIILISMFLNILSTFKGDEGKTMKKILLLGIITSLLIAGCGKPGETETDKKGFKPAQEKVFGE